MNTLQMAATTASVSFKVVMPPEILYEALVSGVCPPTWSPHIGMLIDEAPFEILLGAALETSRQSGVAVEAIWEHMGRWAEAFKSPRTWPPFEDDAIIRIHQHTRRDYSTDQSPAVSEELSPEEIHRMSADGTLIEWMRQRGIKALPEAEVPPLEELGQREPADPLEIANQRNR